MATPHGPGAGCDDSALPTGRPTLVEVAPARSRAAVGCGLVGWDGTAERVWRLLGLSGGPGLAAFAICTAVGALLCVNPILDLVQGPATLEGALAENEVWHGSRSTGVEIAVRTRDGTVVELSPVGIHANRREEMECQRSRGVSMTALFHLDIVIECRGLEE